MGNFDEWLRQLRVLSGIYTQLKDGRCKDKYVYIYYIKICSWEEDEEKTFHYMPGHVFDFLFKS